MNVAFLAKRFFNEHTRLAGKVQNKMSVSHLVVIGASAGGVGVLRRLVADLPADFPAAVLVTVHVPPDRASHLPEILTRSGVLPVSHGREGLLIEPAHIYVAPPNRHLLVDDGHVRLSQGPRENGSRPAIDVLFRSAADRSGSRVIGVLLSGLLDDGTQGLAAIKQMGGLAVVQDPGEAEYASMPLSAMEHVPVDYVLSAALLAPKLVELVRQAPALADPAPPSAALDYEASAVALDKAALEEHGRWGHPTIFTCPDCGGALWEFDEEAVLRYRCHLEHAYGVASLSEQQNEQVRHALWIAVRALEEKASLARRIALRNTERGREASAARFHALSQEAERQANLIQRVILDNETSSTVE